MTHPPQPPPSADAPEQPPVGPVVVQSIAEEYAYVQEHPCPACGGAYTVPQQTLLFNEGRPFDGLQAQCAGCGARRSFLFDISAFFGK